MRFNLQNVYNIFFQDSHLHENYGKKVENTVKKDNACLNGHLSKVFFDNLIDLEQLQMLGLALVKL